MHLLLLILFFIIGALLIFGFYLNYKYFKYLEIKHPTVWKKLNKPTWIPSSSIKDIIITKAFEDKNEYFQLNDLELNSLINFRKKFHFIYKFLLCLYFGIFLLSIFLK